MDKKDPLERVLGAVSLDCQDARRVARMEAGTPSSRWSVNDESDPHGTVYDCERAALAHGNMTDDELANAVFLAPNIGYLTAAKDRIRWLSRKLATREAELQAEVSRLKAIINTPHSGDFLRAVSIEAEHQRQRWGSDHDEGKTPADWFWLVGYLGGKALHAHAAGNAEKAEHHVITTAAACANWHLSMTAGTDMRPGIDGPASLKGGSPT